MAELPEWFEYNLRNLYHIAKWSNLVEQIWEKTKTATAGIVAWWAAIPLLTTATWIAWWFWLWWLVSTWLWILAEKKLQKDSWQAFWTGLWMWWKISTSIWLANFLSSWVFSFLFIAFWVLWALNILYFYLTHQKTKAKEIIEEQVEKDKISEQQSSEIIQKIENIVDNLEESLDILIDWKEQKMSLKYIKNKV